MPNSDLRLDAALKRSLTHSLLVLLFFTFVFITFFSPSLLRGAPLAVGADGQNLYIPNFLARKVFWDIMIFAGFPMMSDPQVMTWYPPALLLSLIPGSWNLFILMPYVLISSFMYGYVLTITESRLAALVSGLTIGMSGFMMAHLGHAVVIHVVSWIPLMLWSFEELRQHLRVKWFVAGSAAIALSFLSGHTPIFTLGFGLATSYAVVRGWSAPVGRWRYYAACCLLSILGIALVAVQIVPAAEIAGQSIRVGYKFSDFISHSLPPYQAIMLVFPKLFGGLAESGALPYFGAENLTELTGYVGFLTLLLAGIGVAKWPERSLSIFWLCVALISVVLAMGNATPFARLIYHVPIVNQFRAPGRHLLEFTFAGTILASLGLATILRKKETSSLVRRTVVLGGLIVIASAVITFANFEKITELASHKDLSPAQVWHWTRWSVGIPLLTFLASALTLLFWARAPKSLGRLALLVAVLIADLASFGWSYDWRYAGIKKEALNPPEIALRYQRLLANHQRVLPAHGTLAPEDEMPPNLSRLWGIPNASGYNSLILSRYSRLMNMQDVGSLTHPLWLDPRDQSLNLAAVRYLFRPSYETLTDERGINWQKDDMELTVGANCVENAPEVVRFNLPSPISSTAIGFVARLACSSHIPDGDQVVQVRITDTTGKEEVESFEAGRDASEWAFDCNQIKPIIKHQRAEVFSTVPAKLNEESCVSHTYVSTLRFPSRTNVTSIELKWVGGLGSMLIDKISLVDEDAHTSQPIDPLTIGDRWKLLEETKQSRVYENADVLPRAWLVSEVVVLPAEQVLTTAKTSRFPDGHAFDPKRTALIEELPVPDLTAPDPNATATVTLLGDNVMEVRTSSATPAFLITSDAYYPGWRASLDGQPVNLYRADYALRGVAVPAGQHLVQFTFRPNRFYLGLAISLAALVGFCSLVLVAFLPQMKRSQHELAETAGK